MLSVGAISVFLTVFVRGLWKEFCGAEKFYTVIPLSICSSLQNFICIVA